MRITLKTGVGTNSSDGRVVRAFAFGAVKSGLIPSRVKPMTIKLQFKASLLDAQHQRNNVGNKPASLFVVPLGKARKRFPHLGVVDRWPPASKRARCSVLMVFS